jgi:hypothetical protein
VAKENSTDDCNISLNSIEVIYDRYYYDPELDQMMPV